MTKRTTIVVALAVLHLATAAEAQSAKPEPPDFYVGATVGAQPQRRIVTAATTSAIFGQTATFTADHWVGNGPFFDVTAGYRWSENLTLGIALSTFDSEGTANGTASIPDKIVFGKISSVPIEARHMKRGERAAHLQEVWFRPVSRKIDVAITAGPSLFYVTQEFVSGSLAANGQTVAYGARSESGLAFGFNAGADTTYLLTPRYGVGLLLRYTWAKASLDAADVTAGGFQGGLGLRLRF